jgi:hypothetical protein
MDLRLMHDVHIDSLDCHTTSHHNNMKSKHSLSARFGMDLLPSAQQRHPESIEHLSGSVGYHHIHENKARAHLVALKRVQRYIYLL